MNLVFTTDTSR